MWAIQMPLGSILSSTEQDIYLEGVRYAIDTYAVLKSNPLTKDIPILSPTAGAPQHTFKMAPLYDYIDYVTFHPYAGKKGRITLHNVLLLNACRRTSTLTTRTYNTLDT